MRVLGPPCSFGAGLFFVEARVQEALMSLWKIVALIVIVAAFVVPYVAMIAVSKRAEKHKRDRRGMD